MKITTLSSSSKGNGYILHNDHEALLLEAGVSFKLVKRALNFDVGLIQGVVISHEHADHAKYVDEYLNGGVRVFANEPTIRKARSHNTWNATVLLPHRAEKIGGFSVLPLSAHHDVPCLSFLVQHKELGSLFFAIDTATCDYVFKGLDYLVCECNYAEDILEKRVQSGYIAPSQMYRLQQTHFELEQVKTYVRACDKTRLKKIILVHLSDGNSDENRFITEIEQTSGVPTLCPRSNSVINL